MKDSNVIGVQEKRELAKIINEDFERIITQLQQEIQYTEGEILEQAKKKFGLELINRQIKKLQEDIAFLEKKRQQLGFDSYGQSFVKTYHKKGEHIIDASTKAGRFYYMKIARHADIQALNCEKAKRLKDLWLTEKRSEVATISNADIKVKLIEHQA